MVFKIFAHDKRIGRSYLAKYVYFFHNQLEIKLTIFEDTN